MITDFNLEGWCQLLEFNSTFWPFWRLKSVVFAKTAVFMCSPLSNDKTGEDEFLRLLPQLALITPRAPAKNEKS